jgi:vitamin B12 transporter
LLSNINEARIDGWELACGAKAGDTNLNVAFTLQNPRNTQTNQMLLHRAKTFSHMAISQPNGNWRLGAEWQYTGIRQDSNILTFAPVTLPAYSVINLTVRYVLDKRLELSLRIDNFLDQNVTLPNGYVPLGRTLFTGLIYR